MNIAVYCGSSFGNRPEIVEKTVELGKWIADNGYGLVFGASNEGLMGTVANTVLDCGGSVLGVSPDVPGIREKKHPNLTECILTKTMSERRNIMIDRADAYIALPGGPGTLDEITEVICLARLNVKRRPCILYNILGYYDSLKAIFDEMEEFEFVEKGALPFVLVSDDLEEIDRFIKEFDYE